MGWTLSSVHYLLLLRNAFFSPLLSTRILWNSISLCMSNKMELNIHHEWNSFSHDNEQNDIRRMLKRDQYMKTSNASVAVHNNYPHNSVRQIQIVGRRRKFLVIFSSSCSRLSLSAQLSTFNGVNVYVWACRSAPIRWSRNIHSGKSAILMSTSSVWQQRANWMSSTSSCQNNISRGFSCWDQRDKTTWLLHKPIAIYT